MSTSPSTPGPAGIPVGLSTKLGIAGFIVFALAAAAIYAFHLNVDLNALGAAALAGGLLWVTIWGRMRQAAAQLAAAGRPVTVVNTAPATPLQFEPLVGHVASIHDPPPATPAAGYPDEAVDGDQYDVVPQPGEDRDLHEDPADDAPELGPDESGTR